MRIRTKIFSSHMALAVTVALFSIVIIATLRVADQHRRHLADSYAQVHNIYLIASEAHHLVEQIAELISIGPQDADIRNSRQILLERLAAQRRLIAEEVETLTSAAQRTAELREIDRIDRIESVIHQLFTAYQRLSEEVAAGRHVVASAIYDSEVENDLDDALDGLLSVTIRRESMENTACFDAMTLSCLC